MRMIKLLALFAARHRVARMRHRATRELAAMSAHELGDMGITRLDVSRLFEPRLVAEFRARDGGRVVAAAIVKPRPQGSAVMASLESLA